jgi:hypothetical protein
VRHWDYREPNTTNFVDGGEALCDEGVQWVGATAPEPEAAAAMHVVRTRSQSPRFRVGQDRRRAGWEYAHEEKGGCACHPCSPPPQIRALGNTAARDNE